ncbi:MAG: hypothetical protein LAO31_02530 [Acidobacteriia bacterium]|nr:hypothetical protein [Terriglobia bacterium]
MRIRIVSNSPWHPSWIEANTCDRRGSAILLALFLTLILSLLGLAFAMASITDTAIHTSNREALGTYYVAEAGNEEAISHTVTTPRSQFNPDKLKSYTGTVPVEVTKCFYRSSSDSVPACPVTSGGGGVNLPVSVGSGKYNVRLWYLGATGTGAGETPIYKYFVSSTATSNSAAVNSSQSAESQFNAEVVENAFPPHPLTSCLEPIGSGTNNPFGLTEMQGANTCKGNVKGTLDPTSPPTWPGSPPPGEENCGVYPMCNFPTQARIKQVMSTNADFSYSGAITDSVQLPTKFWKVDPTIDPATGKIDPTTGQAYMVYIDGSFTVNGSATVYGVYYITGDVKFVGPAQIQGVIFAPNGTMFTGKGGGSPNVPDAVGGVYVHGVTATGSHYKALYNSDYVNAFLGQIPKRMSRAGR